MPESTQTLPEGYALTHEMNLAKDKKLAWKLNLIASVLFLPILAGTIFFGLWVHASDSWEGRFSISSLLFGIMGVFGVIVFHELIHGLFFWFYTRSRPVFAFRLAYAYAAMPEWYLPPRQYVVVGLAPLVLITILGFVLIPFLPLDWVILLAFLISINLAGSAGDALIMYRLWKSGPECLVNDKGDAVYFYQKGV